MKLLGYVDGVEVKFDFYPPNLFKAEIPKQLDGTYIIQLQAVDDAGNITGYSNIFVKIDFTSLKVQILPKNFDYIKNGEGFGYKKVVFEHTKQINDAYSNAEIKQQYTFRELIM